MKRWGLFLLAVLLVSISLALIYGFYNTQNAAAREEFLFGVSFGQETAEEAKLVIDKVKDYTNLFLINSWSIATNETALNEVCDYAAEADLHFMVFFIFVSRIIYPWHQTWLDTAKEKWGDKFLGVYIFDEPGGKQIDLGGWSEDMVPFFENASDYSEAANRFVNSISSTNSVIDVKNRSLQMFTSDYALFWFDYLAGYDTVFAELGWNHSSTQQIGLCRGAARAQGKDWGAIITWTYYEPPYLASGPEILEEMLTAYRAGAKYVVVFDYAEDEVTGKPYSILKEEHFEAMQDFWRYTRSYPDKHGMTIGQVAFVLPKDYGWGMRNVEDKIWGLWAPDAKAQLIWENMNKLISKYDLELDIVYENAESDFENQYSRVYFWNATIQ